jgi:LacI family transcriptional regulator
MANPDDRLPDKKKKPATTRAGRLGPTIRDVARAANVSIGTVSKALHNSGSLKKETRERVLEVVAELGFRPNELAQSLHRGASATVGLISNDSFGRFTMPIMEGLEACLAERRIALFMCNATDDPERERQHVDQLLSKRVDGLIVTARRADSRPRINLGDTGLPVIYVFSQSDAPGSFCLLPDDEGGARLATEHLISQGRQRIAHITGPERFEAVRLRRKGYTKSLAIAGIEYDADLCQTGVWSEAWGREAVDRLFSDPQKAPDALFCGNDQIARGALDALTLRGVRVPEDVAIVGFDNWEVLTNATRPPLSSVDMNLYELGREAGRHLMTMIDGETYGGVSRLPCTLVVRESSAAPGGKPRAGDKHEGSNNA